MEANSPRRWYQFRVREFLTKRRRFRFSLRTALILVTLVGLGLGFVSLRTQGQRAAIARINELGGSFQYDYTSSLAKWSWLRDVGDDEYLLDVVFVRLDGPKVSDADLLVIGKLGRTKRLALNGTDVSDEGLAAINRMFQLEHLDLTKTKVTSKGIRRLRPPRSIMLHDTAVGSDALPHLSGCSQLGLDGTRITSQGLKQLIGCKNLHQLSLQRTAVDDEAVPILAQFTTLQFLNLTDTKISGEGLFALRNALPKCQLAGGCADIADFDPKSRFPETVRGKQFISFSKYVNKRQPLKLLILSSPFIADAHFSMLEGFDSLEVLDLRGASVTHEGLRELQKAFPKLKIYR